MELVFCFGSLNGLELEETGRSEEGWVERDGVQSSENLLLTVLGDMLKGAWYQ